MPSRRIKNPVEACGCGNAPKYLRVGRQVELLRKHSPIRMEQLPLESNRRTNQHRKRAQPKSSSELSNVSGNRKFPQHIRERFQGVKTANIDQIFDAATKANLGERTG